MHGGTLWGVSQEGRKAPGSGGSGERGDGGGPLGGTSPVGRQLEHMRRARALLELQRPKAALVEAQRALSLGPTDADALQLLGLCLVRLGDLAGARQALQSAVAHAPSEPHGHYLLGYTLAELGGPAAENRAKSSAASWSSDGLAARLGASAESLPVGLVGAEKCYRQALALDPEQPVYLRALAELLAQKKSFEEALRLARLAVSLAPERATNHITLGFVASAAGDRQLAREAYMQAIQLEPNSALAWNNLGCIDLAQGRTLHARECFRESLRLDPVHNIAAENLKLVKAEDRPRAIFLDFAAMERQLVLEVWESVLFAKRPRSAAQQVLANHAHVSPPLSPLQLLRRYVFPFAEQVPKKLQDDPRLHAAALLWATEWRTVPVVFWKMPQLFVWMGVSGSLLRLGPAGLAVALSGNLATFLLSRQPLRQRAELYRQELRQLQVQWQVAYDDWLSGRSERAQRDEAMERLIDQFCRFVEALRERPPVEVSKEPDSSTD